MSSNASASARLAAVKARLADGRERNVAEVDKESQRTTGVAPGEEGMRVQRIAKRTETRNSRKARKGNVFGIESGWETEAAAVREEKSEKRREKKSVMSGVVGAAVFSEEALAAAHQKRVRAMEAGMAKGRPRWMTPRQPRQGERGGETRVVDEMTYGGVQNNSPDAVDRVVGELAEVEERRNKFKRRRAFDEDREDIHFINERNRKFNQKISRAYDKHTEEIKQNLERGTALP